MVTENAQKHSLVYAVFSRRTGGLSLGIDPFPDRKYCSFDCPYCEVHPFNHSARFSSALLERELNGYLEAYDFGHGIPIGDICLAGHGEPTLSPELEPALGIMAAARARFWPAGATAADKPKLVIITNATGFADEAVSGVLASYVAAEGLEPWVKLDAGNQGLFERMSGTVLRLDSVAADILRFAKHSPIVVQTMLCAVDGVEPSDSDLDDYAYLVGGLMQSGARISRIDIYSQSRSSPHRRTYQLSQIRMESARLRIASVLPNTPIRVFL